METGNVLRLLDSWKIEGFHYGALGQESVIEVKKLGVKPPQVVENAEWDEEVKMFVPANLIHRAVGLLSVFKPGEVDVGSD